MSDHSDDTSKAMAPQKSWSGYFKQYKGTIAIIILVILAIAWFWWTSKRVGSAEPSLSEAPVAPKINIVRTRGVTAF